VTSVTPERIVHMANQIALFFAAYPQERAEAGVQEHLQKFWTPAMRRDLAAYIAAGGEGLHRLVTAAAQRLPPA
jgi:formate dehydrogenase subunit delta